MIIQTHMSATTASYNGPTGSMGEMSSRTMTRMNEEPEATATFLGIHEWFKCVVQHYGWLFVCKDGNGRINEKKIKAYKCCVKNLHKQIAYKIAETSDADNKKDLHIMKKKLENLMTEIVKDFGDFEEYEHEHEHGYGMEGTPMSEMTGGAKKHKKGKSKSKSKSKGGKKTTKKTKSKSKSKPKSKPKSKSKSKSKGKGKHMQRSKSHMKNWA